MQSRSLRYFLAAYDARNMSIAAEKVNITQPALSKAIQALEANLGVPLFERRPEGVVPTRYADILMRHARRMDMEYRHALAEIDAAGGGSESLLRIGAGPLWYSRFLPTVLEDYLERYPDARVRIQSGVISTLVPQLQSGQLDLICTTLDFPAQAGIIREPVIEVSHTVIARSDHPLKGRLYENNPVSPSDLARFRWIVLADDQVGTGRILSYFAANNLPPPSFAIETSSPTLMFEMLSRGDWLAHIPGRMIPLARRFDLEAIRVEGVFWSAEAGICYRQTDILSQPLSRMVAAIRLFGEKLREVEDGQEI